MTYTHNLDIPAEAITKSEDFGYSDLLVDLINEVVRLHSETLRTKSFKIEGSKKVESNLSDNGCINLKVSNNTPITIRISNQGEFEDANRYPVSDRTGLVVGFHMGNDQNRNSYSDVFSCQAPDISELRGYTVIHEDGSRWQCVRIRSVQDFLRLSNANLRSVAA